MRRQARLASQVPAAEAHEGVLRKIGPAAAEKLRQRIIAELKTTFASHYTKEISLAEALRLDEIAIYGKRSTGTKYLINPNKGITA